MLRMPRTLRALSIITAAVVVYSVSAALAMHNLPVVVIALAGTAAVMVPLWVLIYPAELREERRARGQCPQCGYDLTGNVSGVCPECGAAT
jgi:hypothetical protein